MFFTMFYKKDLSRPLKFIRLKININTENFEILFII